MDFRFIFKKKKYMLMFLILLSVIVSNLPLSEVFLLEIKKLFKASEDNIRNSKDVVAQILNFLSM